MRREIADVKSQIQMADAVIVGAGSGFSSAAGFTYGGQRFKTWFSDFEQTYGFHDMYSGVFFPFGTLEEYWGYFSRLIYINRYIMPPVPVYQELLRILQGKDYFVLTTNVDHCFQRAGFDKSNWKKTIPGELVPHCPVCGRPMTMNLRGDDTFVQDEGWHRAADRYARFLQSHSAGKVLFLEIGVGMNTPGIIKYPFWQMTYQWPGAVYACINFGQAVAPREIRHKSICINESIDLVLSELREGAGGEKCG